MDSKTALTWSWLNVLTKKRYDALAQRFATLRDALHALDARLLHEIGCRKETVEQVLRRLQSFDAAAYAAELDRRGITFVSIEDTAYPQQLHTLPDPPVFLSIKGSVQILQQKSLGMVGTRNMSHYGRRVVQEFVPACAGAGLVTVSGLAIGIDAQVARETLSAGGKTVAVLGHGLGSVHPVRNAQLAAQIVQQGGALVSEFPLDMPPDKYTFPARNRIIAGLSVGTVVLEAGQGSGALTTAALALDYDREVFAVPGQIFDVHYAGCHALIARGHAQIAMSADAIFQTLGMLLPTLAPGPRYSAQNEQEATVLQCLSGMPQQVSDLVERTCIDASIVNATLTILELRGAARNAGGGQWVLC